MSLKQSWAEYKEHFKQSLVEVLVMLSCAIMLVSLVAMFLFVGGQGVRYFLPMSTYQVSTYNSGSDAIIEYRLSHQSAQKLAASIEQKINIQYGDNDQDKPQFIVSEANHLYLLETRNGKAYVGEFVKLLSDENILLDLSELTNIQTLVQTLEQSLKDIQNQKLQSLHRDIDGLSRRNVDKNTPVFKRKLDEFERWQGYANDINAQVQNHRIYLELASDEQLSIAVSDIQSLYQPNQLTWIESIVFMFKKVGTFLSDSPKQGATTGGVFPAIFGTLLMVIIMAVVVTPFGAIAAIYLHEYAPKNRITSMIRISVSNMSAVPSVVYGVFGLGFFVYGMGGSIDSLLYSDRLPSPTFGAPGLLWASLTMGILTLPVVIVSTEEGLRRVPKNLRAGALALGATKYETIRRVVLPMASPGILTGIILAIARAAGEVAPLILVGAVKFAPSLPIDSEFPFMHLERQFMHLGVFIYDGAFHNQTESQVSSLMFASCMLLLLIVFLLNISAIILRNSLRKKYERL